MDWPQTRDARDSPQGLKVQLSACRMFFTLLFLCHTSAAEINELKYQTPFYPEDSLPHKSPPAGRISCYKPKPIENCRTNTLKRINACKRCVTPRLSPSCGCGIVAGIWVSDCNNRDQMGTCGQNSKPGSEHSLFEPIWILLLSFCNLFSGYFPFCLFISSSKDEGR